MKNQSKGRMAKKIGESLLPPFMFRLYYDTKMLIYTMKNNRRLHNSNPFAEEKVILLGNGPSLNKTINDHKDIIKSFGIIVFNNFVESNYFWELKPKYYFVVDPMFFGSEEISDRTKRIIQSLRKVDWDLIFFVPLVYENTVLVKEAKKNPAINIQYLNSCGIRYEYYDQNRINNYLKRNVCNPPAGTVLLSAICTCARHGVKDIVVVGMDYTYLTDIEVDQQTNEVKRRNHYFYKDNGAEILDGGMERVLTGLLTDYKQIRITYQFTRFMKVNLYNAGEYSMVDVIPRRRIEELV